MAMPAVTPHRWTADDVRNLPDEPGKRFECVDGELLVSPGPRLPHQWAVGEIYLRLQTYCRQSGVAAVCTAPGELELDTFTLVQPDLFVLPTVNGRLPKSQEEAGGVLLFVEVLSPSTARFDRQVKRRRYQRYGVEYWIVDVDARLVERWLPTDERPEVLADTLSWRLAGCDEPLTIALPPFFAYVLSEG